MNRKDYIEKRVSHHEYYLSVAHAAGISLKEWSGMPRVRKALQNGDEHLNTIPLATWDGLALGARSAISKALKEHGDFWSLACGVCTMKAAAREAAGEREVRS